MNFNIHDALLNEKGGIQENKHIILFFVKKKITWILREIPQKFMWGHDHVCSGSLVYDCLHDVYFLLVALITFSNFFYGKYVLTYLICYCYMLSIYIDIKYTYWYIYYIDYINILIDIYIDYIYWLYILIIYIDIYWYINIYWYILINI